MAFYAIDDPDDDMIHAADAETRKIYRCPECLFSVKKRKGKYFPHFYHLKTTPHCRLHSKTENHLRAQIQIQKKFPEGTLQMEKHFLKINRIADLCWEQEKIIFEIQCSLISEKEAEMRNNDYAKLGFEVIWLLDDKRYNRRILRPAEHYLRTRTTYYISIQPGVASPIYDQFEVLSDTQRIKKSKKLAVNLRYVYRKEGKVFFLNDRHYYALKNPLFTQYWQALQNQFGKMAKKQNRIKDWLYRNIGKPYLAMLKKLSLY